LLTGKTVVDLLHGTMYAACINAVRTGAAHAFRAPPEFKWPDINGPAHNARILTLHDYVAAVNRTYRRGVSHRQIQAFDTAMKAKKASVVASIDALDDLTPEDLV